MKLPKLLQGEPHEAHREAPAAGAIARPLHQRSAAPRRQNVRGAAALVVTLALLFASSLFAFFVTRGLIFEQRTAANQARAVRAMEAAEAGLDWAFAHLNDPRFIDDRCLPSEASTGSFRERMAPLDAAFRHVPTPGALATCSLATDGLRCQCPADGIAARPLVDAPRFEVRLEAVEGTLDALALIAQGCSGGVGPCDGEATATVSVLLEPRSLLRTLPDAALTATGDVLLEGSFELTAQDEGLLLASGGAVTIGPSVRLRAPGGTPVGHAMVEGDPWLASLGTEAADSLPRRLFGAPLAAMARAPGAARVACSTGDCDTALRSALQQGWQVLWIDAPSDPSPLRLASAGLVIGQAHRPVLLLSPRALAFDGAASLRGLLHLDALGGQVTGPLDLRGAITGGGRLRAEGDEQVAFDRPLLAVLQAQTSAFVRVPGSWRDH